MDLARGSEAYPGQVLSTDTDFKQQQSRLSLHHEFNGQYLLPNTNQSYLTSILHQEEASSLHQHRSQQKAVLIGINYFGQRGELADCVRNAQNMSQYLIEYFKYRPQNMIILTDNHLDPISQPTKRNILCAMHWLLKDTQPSDSLMFYYSGHGGSTEAINNDGDCECDEIIYPVDFRRTGHLTGSELYRIMVPPLQTGVRLTAIFDSYHIITGLTLPSTCTSQGLL